MICVSLLVVQPSLLLLSFAAAAAAQCSLISTLLHPRSLSTELFPSWLNSSLCCTPTLCFSQVQGLMRVHLNFSSFLLAHSSSLSRSIPAGWLSLPNVHFPFSLAWWAVFIRVRLIPSSRSWIMKILNSVSPNVIPWAPRFEEEWFPTTLWSRVVSSPPTTRTTCPDHNSSVSLAWGCGTLYWKLWRCSGRQWPLILPRTFGSVQNYTYPTLHNGERIC